MIMSPSKDVGMISRLGWDEEMWGGGEVRRGGCGKVRGGGGAVERWEAGS